MYSFAIIVLSLIKREGKKGIEDFYISLKYLGDILNIVNIYEIISKRSIFYSLINNDSKYWQIAYFNTDLFRTFSVFIHPIVYSVFLVCLFWINIYLKKQNKFYRYISIILILINLYFTKSRSSWIAFFITIFIYKSIDILTKIRSKKFCIKNSKILKYFVGIVLIIIFSLIFKNYIIMIFDSIYSRFIIATSDSYQDGSRIQRLGTINLISSYMFKSGIINLMFGSGFGTVQNFMVNHTVLISGFTTTDNQYLSFFYEFGLFGLLTYLIVVLLAIVKLVFIDNKRSLDSLNVYIFLSISISMFFFESYGWTDIFIILLFSMVMLCIKIDKEEYIKNEN
jgi:hypothetical protein